MTDVIDPDPMVLYVLMRNDVPDYKPGKAMAQANHAGTQFIKYANRLTDHSFRVHFDEWNEAADGFGICIVLTCTYRELISRTEIARNLGLVAAIVHDPSYPVRDGHRMQHLPVDTCGFVFGRKSRCSLPLNGLQLSD